MGTEAPRADLEHELFEPQGIFSKKTEGWLFLPSQTIALAMAAELKGKKRRSKSKL
jgi:hypothetical protein